MSQSTSHAFQTSETILSTTSLICRFLFPHEYYCFSSTAHQNKHGLQRPNAIRIEQQQFYGSVIKPKWKSMEDSTLVNASTLTLNNSKSVLKQTTTATAIDVSDVEASTATTTTVSSTSPPPANIEEKAVPNISERDNVMTALQNGQHFLSIENSEPSLCQPVPCSGTTDKYSKTIDCGRNGAVASAQPMPVTMATHLPSPATTTTTAVVLNPIETESINHNEDHPVPFGTCSASAVVDEAPSTNASTAMQEERSITLKTNDHL